MSQAYPVKFVPIPQERIWGGHKLKSWFNSSKSEVPIGEYWVLSGHPNGTSIVANGELAGKTLNEIIELDPKAYLGRSPQPRFPLLIKFLEATTDLSVQIHPDDVHAQAHEGDFGKTEAWYILDAKPDGKVNYGHTFQNKAEYLDSVSSKRVKDFLCYQPIENGQVVFVPARTLHALLAGTIVLEVQQTSDVTYRVYDWDRVDQNGKPRELHIEKAAEVMQYGQHSTHHSTEPIILAQTDSFTHQRLLNCEYFTLEKLQFHSSTQTLTRGVTDNPDILIVVEGDIELNYGEGSLQLQRGDTVLIPTNVETYELKTKSDTTVLRTFY
jgi:mannose-6-phosphate isomerase